jgi:hypothetical protein
VHGYSPQLAPEVRKRLECVPRTEKWPKTFGAKLLGNENKLSSLRPPKSILLENSRTTIAARATQKSPNYAPKSGTSGITKNCSAKLCPLQLTTHLLTKHLKATQAIWQNFSHCVESAANNARPIAHAAPVNSPSSSHLNSIQKIGFIR